MGKMKKRHQEEQKINWETYHTIAVLLDDFEQNYSEGFTEEEVNTFHSCILVKAKTYDNIHQFIKDYITLLCDLQAKIIEKDIMETCKRHVDDVWDKDPKEEYFIEVAKIKLYESIADDLQFNMKELYYFNAFARYLLQNSSVILR